MHEAHAHVCGQPRHHLGAVTQVQLEPPREAVLHKVATWPRVLVVANVDTDQPCAHAGGGNQQEGRRKAAIEADLQHSPVAEALREVDEVQPLVVQARQSLHALVTGVAVTFVGLADGLHDAQKRLDLPGSTLDDVGRGLVGHCRHRRPSAREAAAGGPPASSRAARAEEAASTSRPPQRCLPQRTTFQAGGRRTAGGARGQERDL
mmetsp:Transcript_103906/g.263907  ORF Transcript_103906/g.263907 Transcript_103906/m.263907 type:complete len:206 (-) Transcript_103906:142-759(-)